MLHLLTAISLLSPPAPASPACMRFSGGPRAVASLGDVDGDGYPDLLAGHTRCSWSGSCCNGTAYVFSGKDGRVLVEVDGDARDEAFGTSVCAVEDFDADGSPDFAVGAPGDHEHQVAGAVYLHSGKDGRRLLELRAERVGDGFGTELASAGDVDADGVADFVAGAPGIQAAFVFSGKTGARLLQLTLGDRQTTSFGASVAGLGDIDGDGHADVGVGDPGFRGVGGVFAFSGRDGSLLKRIEAVGCEDARSCRFGNSIGAYTASGGEPMLLVGADGADAVGRAYDLSLRSGKVARTFEGSFPVSGLFGTSVAVIGDADGDGALDYAITDSDDGYDDKMSRGQAVGSVQVFSGKTGERLWEKWGDKQHDVLGHSVAAAGDVDRDGVPDVIALAWGGDRGNYVRVYSGKDGRLIHEVRPPAAPSSSVKR